MGLSRWCCTLQDAEVLLILYERLGTTLLPKLRGEFAFCIFDSKTVGALHSAANCVRARWPWQRAPACPSEQLVLS